MPKAWPNGKDSSPFFQIATFLQEFKLRTTPDRGVHGYIVSYFFFRNVSTRFFYVHLTLWWLKKHNFRSRGQHRNKPQLFLRRWYIHVEIDPPNDWNFTYNNIKLDWIIFLSPKLTQILILGKTAYGDVKIMKFQNLDPFCDVIDPDLTPKMPLN